jgi:hypothetical protein
VPGAKLTLCNALAPACDGLGGGVSMPRGRRPRFGGQGREPVGWLLAAVVLFGVLWAVAQVLGWPLWVRVTLVGLAAASLLPRIRDLVKLSLTPGAGH